MTRPPDLPWNLDPRPYRVDQREILGTKFFLQFVYLLGQVLGFLAVFMPINLIELITEIEDLAIGLGFSLISTDDADDLLCQFGSIGLLTLRIERQISSRFIKPQRFALSGGCR